jgi:hypothetical protein
MVMTPALKREWKKHASRYAKTWRTSMFARKKIDWPPVAVREDLLDKACGALSTAQHPVLTKDWLLVEAALATDGTIISNDQEAKGCLEQVASTVGEIKDIVWVDPTEETGTRLWLQNGAEAEAKKKIGRLRNHP